MARLIYSAITSLDGYIEDTQGSIDWDRENLWYAHLHRTRERIRETLIPLMVPPAEQAILDEFEAAIQRACSCPHAWTPVSAYQRRCLLRPGGAVVGEEQGARREAG